MDKDFSDRIVSFLADDLGIEGVSLDAQLSELEIDSLVMVELGMVLEKEFGVVIDEDELVNAASLRSLIDLGQSRKFIPETVESHRNSKK